MLALDEHALPSFDGSRVVVPAPAAGPGNWSGAPSAVRADGFVWLAYRVRRPLDVGRGVAVEIARSRDGESFEPVARIGRAEFGAESFERPALVRLPGVGWRLYVSCATPDSKHWWVEAIDAVEPSRLPWGRRQVVFAGDRTQALKDPVIWRDGAGWRALVCRHPLDERGAEDRMTTVLASSEDGLVWTDDREVLAGTPGGWDERGARATAVLSRDPLTVLYDGRARADQNWFEVTGIAREEDGVLRPLAESPIARSPHSDGAFRYACAIDLDDGRTRYYFEAARPDGAHDLRTVVL